MQAILAVDSATVLSSQSNVINGIMLRRKAKQYNGILYRLTWQPETLHHMTLVLSGSTGCSSSCSSPYHIVYTASSEWSANACANMLKYWQTDCTWQVSDHKGL